MSGRSVTVASELEPVVTVAEIRRSKAADLAGLGLAEPWWPAGVAATKPGGLACRRGHHHGVAGSYVKIRSHQAAVSASRWASSD